MKLFILPFFLQGKFPPNTNLSGTSLRFVLHPYNSITGEYHLVYYERTIYSTKGEHPFFYTSTRYWQNWRKLIQISQNYSSRSKARIISYGTKTSVIYDDNRDKIYMRIFDANPKKD